MFPINKSSHHSKITGNYGEHTILYWLSLSGFECVHVDHTGIDIIAVNKETKVRMGISVKMRSWLSSSSLQVRELNKLNEACENFNVMPYIALVNDNHNTISIFIMTKEVFMRHVNNKDHDFSMSDKHLRDCFSDPDIISIQMKYEAVNWFKENHKKERRIDTISDNRSVSEKYFGR